MNEITTFNFDQMPVRIIMKDDDPWFVASDVATILGYASAKDMVRMLDDDEKGRQIVPTLGGNQEMTIISEPGLYKTIIKSQKAEAKPFQRWVTHDVLPSIRKTGAYVAPRTKQASPLKMVTDAARAFPHLVKAGKLLGCDSNAAAISANQIIQQTAGINLLEIMGRTHLVAANQDSLYYTPTELGRMINTSARGVNLLLAEAGLQMKCDEVWEVTDEGKKFCRIYDTGKRHGSGVPITQIKWAQNVLAVIAEEQVVA
ncbi:BRO-N domain-containing protein [Saezia sanguinis]|uniref:BRO-N domain-containing protein n=1 Tax=Saezia sanguinis TaxID=1965230 RepID=UPI0030568FC2